jgi:hypothetical protein
MYLDSLSVSAFIQMSLFWKLYVYAFVLIFLLPFV